MATRLIPWLGALALAAGGAGAQAEAPLIAPLPATGQVPPAPWRVVAVPGQKMPLTRFSLADVDGRRALRIEAKASYANLVHPIAGNLVAGQLSWQWRVDQLLPEANLREKKGDDAAAKVCVFFDLPLERVPFLERQLLRFARSQSAEPLPAATVCYVWDARLAPGTVLDNAYTRRMRYLVLRSGPAEPGQWASERRDVAADFLRLFGAESPQVPPITGVAVGADADNTRGQSLAHVSALALEP
jgi:Protein of unknown function (DUF3047)